jgi:N-acetyl-gamma-glutamyl-phosphate reductase
VADVAVLGASGYAGAIAATLLHRHPFFALRHVTARSESGAVLEAIHPRTRVPLVLEDYDPDVQGDVDAALVCWPHGVSAPAVAALRERGVRVVDLSADFRLRDPEVYEDWYGRHGAPELFGGGVYGLPELYREAIAGADLVANPGCYPTAALLALAPLARAGAIADVVIDAKSGVSGAGREPSQTTHYVSADENMTPYKVERHRHTPEIEQELAALGASLAITFTPHLVPLAQGELVSSYVTPKRELSDGELADLYREAYEGERWVEVRLGPPGVLEVRDTNYCRLSVHRDGRTGRVLVFSAIDNLWKGAASQAVQNLNLMFGRDESEGLG